jgi:hypothetical protein
MELTYQQILAQQYAENATVLLAQPPTEGDVDVYEQRTSGYNLDNPDEFRQFAGDRNQPDIISRPQAFEDKSKLSVRYNKDVLTPRSRDSAAILPQRSISATSASF